MPGTSIPGVITAGTFYQDGKRIFWDVHNPENKVVIELRDDRHGELIIQVADPKAAVELVEAVLLKK
jgi:roadblock/LC7 domain-containing protein